MSTDVDHGALRTVTTALHDAGTDLDESGGTFTGIPDAGDASALIGEILKSMLEACGLLAAESMTLASLADDCNVDYASTDSQVATDLLMANR